MRRPIVAGIVAVAASVLTPSATARPPHVLRVGTFDGIPGQFRSIQAAVDAAKPGDWILIGPGDYKTTSSRAPNGGSRFPAGVLITTRDLHLRGMNRNTVVIDGTRAGSRCSRSPADQNFGPGRSGGPAGLNGILVWKADDVWLQNLTVCNFLGGSAGDGVTGSAIWWTGGAGSGKIGGWGFLGSYLTATSTFYRGESTAAHYGIFSGNWSGGVWNDTYASNFNDSGYYIGACQQVCDQVIDHAHAEYDAVGYSGTNSGGRLVVEYSEFNNNEDGFDTNSQDTDLPPPQNGACPNDHISPITHTHSCWVFMHNYVHNNNNPDVPALAITAGAPLGTGMSVSGGRNDTIMDNRFVDNDAWAVIFVPYLQTGPTCTEGAADGGASDCLFDQWGDALIGNTFAHNGSYGHPSNGDIGEVNLGSGHPTDCFSGNREAGGGSLSPDLAQLEISHPSCNGAPMAAGSSDPKFFAEGLCDSQTDLVPGVPPPCPAGQYPRRTTVVMHTLPKLASMPDPCVGVPANPWCAASRRRG